MEMKQGKIGFFDSGLGGLTILKEAAGNLPGYSYIYLGDNLHAPYGDKSAQEIFAHTLAGAEWLFSQGAEIIILACNTASAIALRKIQRDILPAKYPGKKVLGIIIPTSEEADRFSRTQHVGVLATEATVRSGVFEIEMLKSDAELEITNQAGGRLVELIESGVDERELTDEIRKVVGELLLKDPLIDVLVLGCTHYALIIKLIEKSLPSHIKIINEAPLVADKLRSYLDRHQEIVARLGNDPRLEIFTTSPDEATRKLIRKFYGEEVEVKVA
jgi:glutamate racemase